METQCSFSAGLCDKTTFSCLPGCVSTYNPESTEQFPSPFCPSHHLMSVWKRGIYLVYLSFSSLGPSFLPNTSSRVSPQDYQLFTGWGHDLLQHGGDNPWVPGTCVIGPNHWLFTYCHVESLCVKHTIAPL